MGCFCFCLFLLLQHECHHGGDQHVVHHMVDLSGTHFVHEHLQKNLFQFDCGFETYFLAQAIKETKRVPSFNIFTYRLPMLPWLACIVNNLANTVAVALALATLALNNSAGAGAAPMTIEF